MSSVVSFPWILFREKNPSQSHHWCFVLGPFLFYILFFSLKNKCLCNLKSDIVDSIVIGYSSFPILHKRTPGFLPFGLPQHFKQCNNISGITILTKSIMLEGYTSSIL